jgi:hypothetical protein
MKKLMKSKADELNQEESTQEAYSKIKQKVGKLPNLYAALR